MAGAMRQHMARRREGETDWLAARLPNVTYGTGRGRLFGWGIGIGGEGGGFGLGHHNLCASFFQQLSLVADCLSRTGDQAPAALCCTTLPMCISAQVTYEIRHLLESKGNSIHTSDIGGPQEQANFLGFLFPPVPLR